MNETNRSSGPVPADLVVMNREGQAIWDANAETWDAKMGDAGGGFQRGLIGPVVDRLLAVQPGERVLDAATGNGVFARRLAAQGRRSWRSTSAGGCSSLRSSGAGRMPTGSATTTSTPPTSSK